MANQSFEASPGSCRLPAGSTDGLVGEYFPCRAMIRPRTPVSSGCCHSTRKSFQSSEMQRDFTVHGAEAGWRVFDCADQMSLPPDTFDPLRVDPAVVFGEQARDHRPDVVRPAGRHARVRSYQQGSLLKSGLLRTGPPPVSIALGPIVLTAMPVCQRLGAGEHLDRRSRSLYSVRLDPDDVAIRFHRQSR